MSALLHFYGDVRIECDDDEAVLWVRSKHNTASVELTPCVIEQLEAAIKEARKFRAMGEPA